MQSVRSPLRRLPAFLSLLAVLVSSAWSPLLVCVSGGDATLSSFSASSGQFLVAYGPSDLVRIRAVRWDTVLIFVTAAQTTPGGTMEYRYTTGGVASTWTLLTDNVNSAVMPSTGVVQLGDHLVEVKSTASDGDELIYSMQIECDMPALEEIVSPRMTTEDGANVLWNRKLPPNGWWENYHRVYLPVAPHLPNPTVPIRLNVSSPYSPRPQCQSRIFYYQGWNFRAGSPFPDYSQMIESATPGELQVTLPWMTGFSYLYIRAINTAGRQESMYVRGSTALLYVQAYLQPYPTLEVSELGICDYFDVYQLDHPVCAIPYYITTLQLRAAMMFVTPNMTFFLNGASVLHLTSSVQDNGIVDVPLVVGLNTLTVDTIHGTYRQEYLVPPPGTGFGRLNVRVVPSATTLTSADLLLVTGELDVANSDSRTRAEDLTWEWTASWSTPDAAGDFNFTSYLQPNTDATGRQLLLSRLPVGTYAFHAVASDILARPDASGNRRTATMFSVDITIESQVKVLPPLQSASAAAVDPCARANPCKNNQRCTAVRHVGDTAQLVGAPPGNNTTPASQVTIGDDLFSLYCICPSARPQFFGADCSFSILGCPQCMAAYSADRTLTILGLGLTSTLQMAVGGVPATLQSMRTVNASDAEYVREALAALAEVGVVRQELIALTFVAPRLLNLTNDTAVLSTTSARALDASVTGASSRSSLLPSSRSPRSRAFSFLSPDVPYDASGPVDAYLPMQISAALPGVVVQTRMEFRTLVYYTSSTCLEVGQWKPDGQGGCLECPEGGYCPGANRVWPLVGYYGYSEYVAPASCRVAEACTGMDVQLAAGSAGGTGDYFAVGNEAAKCTEGYEGVKCADCSSGYYQQSIHCYPCDESVDQSAQLTLVALTVVVLVVCLSLCVAAMTTDDLCVAVGRFLMLQQIATVGVSAAPSLPTHAQEVTAFFVWLDLLNFNLELLKPGCAGIPSFSFVIMFFSVLLFMLATSLLFTLACCCRLLWKRYRYPVELQKSARAAAEAEQKAKQKEKAMAARDDDDDSQSKGHRVGEEGEPTKEKRKASKKDKENEGAEAEADDELPLPPDTPMHDFKKRLLHSLLILLALMYLRVTALLCENFVCAVQPEPVLSTASNAAVDQSLLLESDGSTRCYHGQHTGSTALAIFFMMAYTLGFPALLFVLLLRSFGSEETAGCSGWAWKRFAWLRGDNRWEEKWKRKLAEFKQVQAGAAPAPAAATASMSAKTIEVKAKPLTAVDGDGDHVSDERDDASAALLARVLARDQSDSFGFIYEGLRPSQITFVLHMLLIQALFAVVQVFFAERPLLQLFLYGVVTFLDCLHTAWSLPWEGYRENVIAVSISVLTLVQGVVLLGTQESGVESPFFGLQVAMVGLILLVLAVPQVRERVKKNLKMSRVQDGEGTRAANPAAAVGKSLAEEDTGSGPGDAAAVGVSGVASSHSLVHRESGVELHLRVRAASPHSDTQMASAPPVAPATAAAANAPSPSASSADVAADQSPRPLGDPSSSLSVGASPSHAAASPSSLALSHVEHAVLRAHALGDSADSTAPTPTPP